MPEAKRDHAISAKGSGILERDLADALGQEGLERLVAAYGGRRLRVHSQPILDSNLAKCLGADSYAALQRTFRGEELDIPTLRYRECQARRARIWALAGKGHTANDISGAVGLSLRRVREILACRLRS